MISHTPIELPGYLTSPIRRAQDEIERADRVLWVFDAAEDPHHDTLDRSSLPPGIPVTLIRNKVDLTGATPGLRRADGSVEVAISAKSGAGVEILRAHLKECVGYLGPQEGEFTARRRHLVALARGASHLQAARSLMSSNPAAELVAEELRLAHNALSEITG